MDNGFDPYLTWLGISPEDRPPTHYMLLGIPALTSDADLISGAADERVELIRNVQSTKDPAISQQLLDQIWLARACLLDSRKKAAYDAELTNRMAAGYGHGALVKKLPPAVPMFQAASGRPQSVAPIEVSAQPENADDTSGSFSVRTKRLPRKQKRKSWGLSVIVLLVFLIIALVGGGAYLLRRDQAELNLAQQGATTGNQSGAAAAPVPSAPTNISATHKAKSSLPPSTAEGSNSAATLDTSTSERLRTTEPKLLPLSADKNADGSLPLPKESGAGAKPPATGGGSDAGGKGNAETKDQDVLGAKVRAFKASAEQAKAPSELKSLSEQGIQLVRQAIDAHRQDLAQECADVSLVAARRCDCTDQLRRITLLVLEVQQMQSK